MSLRFCLSCAVLLYASSLAAQTKELPRTHRPQPTSAAINVQDLMTRDYIIADDSMEGRQTGSFGSIRATNYIAAELKRLGLKPAGENGTYFQTLPWVYRRPDTLATLHVGTTSLSAASDFSLIQRRGSIVAGTLQPYGAALIANDLATVWGGNAVDAATIDPSSIRNKLLFLLAPTAPGGGPQLTYWNRETLAPFLAAGAKAIGIVVPDSSIPTSYHLRVEFYDDPTVSGKAITILAFTQSAVGSIFGNKLPALRPGVSGNSISGQAGWIDTPHEAPARNVIAILPGSDPKLRGQFVAVGAHSDHIGISPRPADHDSVRAYNQVMRPRGANDQGRLQNADQAAQIQTILDSLRKIHVPRQDSINNGADDDGSGTVFALEIAEAFALTKTHLKRSILFVWHTGEEKGLYGSQYFTNHPTVARDSIVAQVNMDQLGRGEADDAPRGGANSLVVIGARRLSTEIGDRAESLNAKSKSSFTLDYSFDQNGDPANVFCRIDHYMYARYGIPGVSYAAVAWHRDYHMITDEPQYLAFPRMAKIANYIEAVIADIANLPQRPVVDKPKPDPNGVCKQ